MTALDTSLAEASVQYGQDGTAEVVVVPEHHWLRGHQPAVGEWVMVLSQEGDYFILGTPETFFDFPPAVRVQRNVTGSSLGTGSDTAIPWHEVAYEYGAMWDAAFVGVTGVAGTDVQIPLAGVYDLDACAGTVTNGTGRRILTLFKNTTPIARSEPTNAPPSGSAWYGSVSTQHTFAAGDSVQCKIFQSSGGALAFDSFIFANLGVSWKRPA